MRAGKSFWAFVPITVPISQLSMLSWQSNMKIKNTDKLSRRSLRFNVSYVPVHGILLLSHTLPTTVVSMEYYGLAFTVTAVPSELFRRGCSRMKWKPGEVSVGTHVALRPTRLQPDSDQSLGSRKFSSSEALNALPRYLHHRHSFRRNDRLVLDTVPRGFVVYLRGNDTIRVSAPWTFPSVSVNLLRGFLPCYVVIRRREERQSL